MHQPSFQELITANPIDLGEESIEEGLGVTSLGEQKRCT